MPRAKYKVGEYVQQMDLSDYEKIPKSVFAALAISFGCLVCGDTSPEPETIKKILLSEWWILYEGGHVPQKPYKKIMESKQ